jgi:anaerobic selenocysteine-containing dehydrogenase
MELGGQCHALATVLHEDWYTSCVGCGARCSVWMGVENLRNMSLFVIILSGDCRPLSM